MLTKKVLMNDKSTLMLIFERIKLIWKYIDNISKRLLCSLDAMLICTFEFLKAICKKRILIESLILYEYNNMIPSV